MLIRRTRCVGIWPRERKTSRRTREDSYSTFYLHETQAVVCNVMRWLDTQKSHRKQIGYYCCTMSGRRHLVITIVIILSWILPGKNSFDIVQSLKPKRTKLPACQFVERQYCYLLINNFLLRYIYVELVGDNRTHLC